MIKIRKQYIPNDTIYVWYKYKNGTYDSQPLGSINSSSSSVLYEWLSIDKSSVASGDSIIFSKATTLEQLSTITDEYTIFTVRQCMLTTGILSGDYSTTVSNNILRLNVTTELSSSNWLSIDLLLIKAKYINYNFQYNSNVYDTYMLSNGSNFELIPIIYNDD